jgi:zinc/manganese transport system substrate-binding protein
MGRVRSTAVRTATAALTVLGVAACSGGGTATDDPAVATGDPAACPGEVVDVVVSVGQWADVVHRLGGDCATVTTIVASGAVDPHDFDPGTADLAAFTDADLVVLNGAGYDTWASDAVATLDPRPAVVSAADVSHVPDQGADPHIWYDPEAVRTTAAAITGELSALSPDSADYLADQATAWQEDLQPYLAAIDSLRATAAGRSFAATEPVFDRMAAAIGLVDATPEGYRRASSNDSDPAPGDLTAFEAALGDGSVDALVYNTQTSGSVPDQLRAAAERAGVPVVEVTESPADTNGSFVAWQLAQLSQLSDALDGTP